MSTPTGGQGGGPAPPKPMTLDDITRTVGELTGTASFGTGRSTGKISPDSLIYTGATEGIVSTRTREGVVRYVAPTMTYSQARLLPGDWMQNDPAMLKKLVNTGILNKVPGFNAGMGLPDIISGWEDLVATSYELNQRTDSTKKWTPWDVLATYGNPKSDFGTIRQGDWLYDAATGAKVKYVGPRSKTTTSRDVNLSSAEDVKALTTQVLTQALGRAPTASEVAQYKATINTQEEANPQMTTTTTTLDDQGEAVSQSSKSTGGFSAAAQEQTVLGQAQETPEYAKYQAGTTYWNAMMQMLVGG